MTYQPTVIDIIRPGPLKLPNWAALDGAQTPERLGFQAGAMLTVLDNLLSDPSQTVPDKLLANRLALRAAVATSRLEGRLAREADIRDAFHLTTPGEARGPDGDLLAYWRKAGQPRLGARDWQSWLKDLAGTDFENAIPGWIEAAGTHTKTYGPLAGCVWGMRAVLAADDRAERVACLVSDVVLARALGWRRVLPISAQHLTKAMLRDFVAERQGADLTVQAQILKGIEDTIHLARDLASGAAALRSVVPKLRAKGSDAAVDLFLTEDAVLPSSMLSPVIQGTATHMTARAARRFCDRLVELGVAHEVTGRATFRMYGLSY